MNPYSKTIINSIFILSLLYWIILAACSTMLLGGDAEGYNGLGHLIAKNGWQEYFPTGPNREPAYPFLVAFSIKFSSLFNIHYHVIQKIIQISILFLSQWLLCRLWIRLNVSPKLLYLGLIYWTISPSITNCGMSLYSEIIALPLILLLIFNLNKIIATRLNISQGLQESFKLGLILLGLISVKAVFEIIVPLLLISLVILTLSHKELRPQLQHTLPIFALAFLFFQVGVNGYKALNLHFNHHWAITDRGAWALYGNTARRMEPLTQERLLGALAYVPGEGFCERVLHKDVCQAWSSGPSDHHGMTANQTLSNQKLSSKEHDNALFTMTIREISKNPLQYALLCGLEGIKMFFWESTRIGFVQYPPWLDQLHQNFLFKNTLRLLIFILTSCSFFICLFNWQRIPILLKLCMITSILFISIHTPFFILTRYTFVIVPLLLTIILYGLNHSIAGKDQDQTL